MRRTFAKNHLLCCEEAACPIISKESIKISFRLTLPSPRLKSIVVWKKNNRTHWIRVMLSLAATFCPNLFLKIYFPEVAACQCEGCRVVEEQSSSVFLPHQPSGSESCWGLCCEIYFHKKRVWIIHQQMDCPQSNLICSSSLLLLPPMVPWQCFDILTDFSWFSLLVLWQAKRSIFYQNQ